MPYTSKDETAQTTDQNGVVSIFGYQRHLRFPAIATIETYWQALRHENSVPLRTQVDPRGIENALEYAFIAQRIAPGLARLRLAGMHMSDLLGMDVRGMPLSTFLEPQDRQKLADAMEQMFSTPAKCELDLRSEGRIGQPPLDAKLILLPLRDDMGDVTRILGALVSHGKISRAPRRFTVADVRIQPLQTPNAAQADAKVKTQAKAPSETPQNALPNRGPDHKAKLEKDLATIRAIHAKSEQAAAKRETRPALRLIDCDS